jgi:hypothetical protein
MATDKDDDMGRSWMHATGSAKRSSKPVLPTTTSRDRAGLDHSRKSWDGLDRSNWIRKCAQQILSSYRRDDFADPDGYLVQLGMVLERYDDAVIRAVTSPLTGIQRSCKFPPSIAEFVEFIDEHIRRTSYVANFDEQAQKQLVEREEEKCQLREEPLEYRRKVAERILAQYRAQLVPPETKPQLQTWRQFPDDDLRAMYPPKAGEA